MLLKHNDWVDIVTTHPVCSTQHPEQLPKKSGATYQSCQHVIDRQVDYIGSVPLSVRSKYALGYVETASGLTHIFPCHCANQAATTRGLEKLSTMDRCPHR